jgi:hypothetical protein
MTTGTSARSMPLRSPLPKTSPRKATPLRLVPQRRSSAARAPFVVVVVTLLGGGLLGLLLLNTLVAQGSFALHDLSAKGKALEQREQQLARQVQALQAPAVLAHRAAALGMVPGGPPAFLRLPDGKVLGKPMPGVAPVQPPTTASARAGTAPAAGVSSPQGSTTWTAPRQSPPPASRAAQPAAQPTGARR